MSAPTPSLLGPETAIRMGQGLDDQALLLRVREGDARFFEVLMRRHNERVFRTARSVVSSDEQAEEIMQEAYVRAFTHLDQFEGRSSFCTWLTKIALHAAFARKREVGGERPLEEVDLDHELDAGIEAASSSPEAKVHRGELRALLERAVDALPDGLKTVFVLREIQGLSVAETATCLELTEENVKVRLFRARAALKKTISDAFEGSVADLFGFHLVRCDRVVSGVLVSMGNQAA